MIVGFEFGELFFEEPVEEPEDEEDGAPGGDGVGPNGVGPGHGEEVKDGEVAARFGQEGRQGKGEDQGQRKYDRTIFAESGREVAEAAPAGEKTDTHQDHDDEEQRCHVEEITDGAAVEGAEVIETGAVSESYFFTEDGPGGAAELPVLKLQGVVSTRVKGVIRANEPHPFYLFDRENYFSFFITASAMF